jgi:hypothetical protein
MWNSRPFNRIALLFAVLLFVGVQRPADAAPEVAERVARLFSKELRGSNDELQRCQEELEKLPPVPGNESTPRTVSYTHLTLPTT